MTRLTQAVRDAGGEIHLLECTLFSHGNKCLLGAKLDACRCLKHGVRQEEPLKSPVLAGSRDNDQVKAQLIVGATLTSC